MKEDWCSLAVLNARHIKIMMLRQHSLRMLVEMIDRIRSSAFDVLPAFNEWKREQEMLDLMQHHINVARAIAQGIKDDDDKKNAGRVVRPKAKHRSKAGRDIK